MRLIGVVLALSLLSSAAFADPTDAQLAVIKKYDGAVFSADGLKAGKAQDNGWTPYAWTEGRTLWMNAARGYSAVVEPSGTEIYRYSPERFEYHFSDGRVVKSNPQTGERTWSPGVGDLAPDFDLTTLDGQPVKLSSLRGSVVLLDFWASWCGPCQEYLPGTEALWRKYKERGLKVFGVNIEGNLAAAKKNAESLKLTFPSVMAQNGPNGANWDSVQVADYWITGIPHAVLIDKKGVIRSRETVFQNEAVLTSLLGP